MLLVAIFRGKHGERVRSYPVAVEGAFQLQTAIESVAEMCGERVSFRRHLTQGEEAAQKREIDATVRQMELALETM